MNFKIGTGILLVLSVLYYLRQQTTILEPMSLDKKTEKKCKKEQKQQKQKKRDLGCGFNKLNMQDDGTMTPCVHQVYVHHIVEQPHCKPMVRKGGIFSRDYDELNRYDHRHHHVHGHKHTKHHKNNKVYNYGAPGSLLSNRKKFAVKYSKRPSVTGMFTDVGPYSYNKFPYLQSKV